MIINLPGCNHWQFLGDFFPTAPKTSPAAIVSYSEMAATSNDGCDPAVLHVCHNVNWHFTMNACGHCRLPWRKYKWIKWPSWLPKKNTLTSGTMCPKPSHLSLSSPIFLYWLLLSTPSYFILLAYTIIRVFFSMFMFYSDVYMRAYPYHAPIREHLIYLYNIYIYNHIFNIKLHCIWWCTV